MSGREKIEGRADDTEENTNLHKNRAKKVEKMERMEAGSSGNSGRGSRLRRWLARALILGGIFIALHYCEGVYNCANAREGGACGPDAFDKLVSEIINLTLTPNTSASSLISKIGYRPAGRVHDSNNSRLVTASDADNPALKGVKHVGRLNFIGGGSGHCTGAMISKDYMLTAAHCFYKDPRGSAFLSIHYRASDRDLKGKKLAKDLSPSSPRICTTIPAKNGTPKMDINTSCVHFSRLQAGDFTPEMNRETGQPYPSIEKFPIHSIAWKKYETFGGAGAFGKSYAGLPQVDLAIIRLEQVACDRDGDGQDYERCSAGEIWGHFDTGSFRSSGARHRLYRAGFGEVGGDPLNGTYMHIDTSAECRLINRCEDTVKSSSDIVYHLCDAGEGDSGGPIVDRDTGRLIGVLQGYLSLPPPPNLISFLTYGLIQTVPAIRANVGITLHEARGQIGSSYIRSNRNSQ